MSHFLLTRLQITSYEAYCSDREPKTWLSSCDRFVHRAGPWWYFRNNWKHFSCLLHNQVQELKSYTRLVHFQPINIRPPRFGIVSTFKSLQDYPAFVRWLHGYEVCDIYKRLPWICRADCFDNKHAWSIRGTPNVHSISPKIWTSSDKHTCCGNIDLYLGLFNSLRRNMVSRSCSGNLLVKLSYFVVVLLGTILIRNLY